MMERLEHRMVGDPDARDSAGSSAADKVLSVLAAFELRTRWPLRDLAEHLGLPKSSVHRFLAALKASAFVEQDPRDGAYHLGPTLWRIASRARDFDVLADTALPTLQHLVDATGESAFLTVQNGLHSLCIARVNTPHGVRLLLDVGTASPLHLGASNTALLAFLPDVERSMILAQTVLQPAERQRAEEEMRRIVSDGFAYSSEQLTPGAAALGVPVFDADRRLIACLSIGAPAYRFEWERAHGMLPELRRAAIALAQRIGHVRASR
jgi:IclR family transcriptional regulator, KDG regulon repressor